MDEHATEPVGVASGPGRPTTAEPGEGAVPRDAVILVPGLAAEWGDHTLEGTAGRIAAAFDRNAATAAARFTVKLEVGEEEYGKALKTRVCTLVRADGAKTTPVLDMYDLHYQDALTRRFERRNLLVKALLVFLAVLTHAPRVVRALLSGQRSGKTLKETVQVAYALGILLLLTVYMALLVWALVQTVTKVPEFGGRNPSATVPQAVVVVSAAVGVLLPGLRERISRAAVSYLSLIYYLSLGERRQVIAGRLSALVEHVAERLDPPYGRIHIISYSFGTIVTLDSVFPKGKEPVRRFELLDTLVTIGTPYDAIRSWWRRYFGDRHALPGHPSRWINVYAPADVLGSNFRNDAVRAPATESVHLAGGGRAPLPENVAYSVGPTLEEVGPIGVVTLIGLRAHRLYWEEEEEAETVFSVLVPVMYAGTPALA